MVIARNVDEIAKRGGLVLSDSDFVLVVCCNCGQQYLYDEEICTLYLAPNDLSQRWLNATDSSTVACTGCLRTDWDFEDLPISKMLEAQDGPWAWAL